MRLVLTPPWSLAIRDEAPLTLVVLVRGDAWVAPEKGTAVRLTPGDTAIVRGPAPYRVADDLSTEPQAVIHPGQRCTGPDGGELRGMSEWGCGPGATVWTARRCC